MLIRVRIVGVTPLILNRFTDEAQEASSSGTRTSAAAGDRGTPREIAEKKLYLGADGKTLVLPQPNVLRSIVDGGQFHKAGKAQITTKEKSMLYGCLDIPAAEIPIEHSQPWTVDTRAVVIPSTKGRILAHRPRFDDWALAFELELDTTIASERLLRDIVDDAGKRVGLGDFRPARKGPFGRYLVDHWHAEAEMKRAA